MILIMTTNAGASVLAKSAIGFGRDSREGEDEEEIKRVFTPEFRNRLDATVPFSYLPQEVVERVVEKFILELEMQLADRNVHIRIDEDARAWLAVKGYDKSYGARPLSRVIQEHVKKPLADSLLFGDLKNGGEVVVHLKDDALSFEIVPGLQPKKKGGSKPKKEPVNK